MSFTLTIGIPTYNRFKSLKEMLPKLFEAVSHLRSKVEIIVSDNCSTDETEVYLNDFKSLVDASYSFTVNRNEQNIGVSKNITKLFELATAKYFMFLGDDDLLHSVSLQRIMDVLESADAPSAVIQTAWPWVGENIPKQGYVSWPGSFPFFYEYGNAWAGIIETKPALNAIRRRNIVNETEATVWPQTIMAFLAMYDLREKKMIYLANFKIGDPLDDKGLNLVNMEYFFKSLLGLLSAFVIIYKHTRDKDLLRTFLSSSCHAMKAHFLAMVKFALIMPYKIDNGIPVLLRRSGLGIRGYIASAVFSIFLYPKFLRAVAKTGYCLIKISSPGRYDEKITSLRHAYALKESNYKKHGIRYDNWF